MTFLALGSNKISIVENIHCLTRLEFLDLSENDIEERGVDVKEFPPCLQILDLSGNPCASSHALSQRIIDALPSLFIFNQKRVRGEGATPYDEPVKESVLALPDEGSDVEPSDMTEMEAAVDKFDAMSESMMENVRSRIAKQRESILDRMHERRSGLRNELDRARKK